MKYLLMLAFLGLVWWLWAKRRVAEQKGAMPRETASEKMMTCAHCGVHFPESDGVSVDGRFYCSEAHRLASGSAER